MVDGEWRATNTQRSWRVGAELGGSRGGLSGVETLRATSSSSPTLSCTDIIPSFGLSAALFLSAGLAGVGKHLPLSGLEALSWVAESRRMLSCAQTCWPSLATGTAAVEASPQPRVQVGVGKYLPLLGSGLLHIAVLLSSTSGCTLFAASGQL